MKTGFGLSLLAVLLLAATPAAAVLPSGDEEMAHPEVPRITAEELKKLMDKKGEYVLLDVRDSYSYDLGHIEGAQNISFAANEDPTTRGMMLMALPMETLIILYCD
jgi:predicted sulfurtransferase